MSSFTPSEMRTVQYYNNRDCGVSQSMRAHVYTCGRYGNEIAGMATI